MNTEPAFDLWNPQPLYQYLFGFAAAIAAVYALWIVVLIILNFGGVSAGGKT